MTTTPQTATHEKTRGKAGLVSVLGDHQPATEQTLQGDVLLKKLYDILRPNSLLDIKVNLSVNQGDILPTAGMTGLVLHNKDYEPVSLLCVPPNGKPKDYVVTDPFETGAFIIGKMDSTHELIAVNNIADAVELAYLLMAENVTILASRDEWSFNDMVKHFAQDSCVTIMATADVKDEVTKPLIGANVRAIITSERTVLEHLDYGNLSYKAILTLDDTKIVELRSVGWPEPESLSTDPSKQTPYPIEAWSGLLQRVIKKIAHYTQVPEAMVGQCLLGGLAHMGQAHVDAPFGYKHMPTSLIIITEGESGSGKTQAMDLTHYKIKEHEQKRYEEYIIRHNEHKLQLASLKGPELKEYQATTPAPYNPERLFKDATIEPILDKFVSSEITDASWSTDDAAQFFNGHTMKGDTAGNALAAITDLYSGGEVNRTRSMKTQHANPHTKAFNVRMTLMLMAQRIILEPALTDDMMNQQGFLARALIACPDSLQGYRTWDDINRRQQSPYRDTDLIAYWDRCNDLLDPVASNAPTDDKGAPKRFKMRWHDAQTEQVFYEHMQVIENRQAKGKTLEYLKAYASRMAENASRIASLIAFFDKRQTITTDDIKRAFMLVEYSTAERLRYQDATPTGEQSDLEKLSIWLVSKAKAYKPAVLNKSYVTQNAPNALRGKKLNFLLDDLESMGHIRLESDVRRRLVYVNPRLIID
ncbi:DUF3987 domain-containing protein [Psychrobacter sp. 219-2-C]|uniref:DUF3987 domain-containing protein n=1 Tax=Psychrobacter sp. 219-2-C TaxID=3414707 RepID=UPI003C6E4CE9